MSFSLNAQAACVRVASDRPDHDTGELTPHPFGPASSLGASEGFPPPAIDVYSRNTASTAATESAMTSRAGLAFRATRVCSHGASRSPDAALTPRLSRPGVPLGTR